MKLLKTIAIAAFGLAALSPLLACSPSSSTEPTGTASKVPTVVLPAAYCVPLVEPDAATGEAGSIVAQAGLQVIAKAGDKVVACWVASADAGAGAADICGSGHRRAS